VDFCVPNVHHHPQPFIAPHYTMLRYHVTDSPPNIESHHTSPANRHRDRSTVLCLGLVTVLSHLITPMTSYPSRRILSLTIPCPLLLAVYRPSPNHVDYSSPFYRPSPYHVRYSSPFYRPSPYHVRYSRRFIASHHTHASLTAAATIPPPSTVIIPPRVDTL
jgi:hypothetical protein